MLGQIGANWDELMNLSFFCWLGVTPRVVDDDSAPSHRPNAVQRVSPNGRSSIKDENEEASRMTPHHSMAPF
jgi:hypothetical protein